MPHGTQRYNSLKQLHSCLAFNGLYGADRQVLVRMRDTGRTLKTVFSEVPVVTFRTNVYPTGMLKFVDDFGTIHGSLQRLSTEAIIHT